ncbi:MAG: hypothetical protein GY797_25120 [Deltaproteobacteria bacterium]|nr:hypothetical protein [Deltaproteobacteria bacterium]MCP4985866.1 hypothetical protein [Colwellia sp.]
MKLLLKNDDGEFFVFPVLKNSQNKSHKRMHIKKHKSKVTLCGEHCSSSAKILKEIPPDNHIRNWDNCPVCMEKVDELEFELVDELSSSILESYPEVKVKFKNPYLTREFVLLVVDSIRFFLADLLPTKFYFFVRPPARSNSWDNRPMPDLKESLQINHTFSSEKFRRIKAGFIPKVMEDKWFIYYQDGWLYFHRGWTGICIYQLRIKRFGRLYKIVETWVNRDPDQNEQIDSEYDIELLKFLIDRLLLGKNVPFPFPPGEASMLFQHGVVGDSRANDEEL